MKVLNANEIQQVGGGDDWWRVDPNMGRDRNSREEFNRCVGDRLMAQINAGALSPSILGAAWACWQG